MPKQRLFKNQNKMEPKEKVRRNHCDDWGGLGGGGGGGGGRLSGKRGGGLGGGGVIIIQIKSHYDFSSPAEPAATANTTLSQEHKEPRPFRGD